MFRKSRTIVCKDIIGIIVSFIPQYDLEDWVNPEKLSLSAPPDYLKSDEYRYMRETTKFFLSQNPRAKDFILHYFPDEINWSGLNLNPADWAVEILLKNPTNVIWYILCENPNDKVVDKLLEASSRDDINTKYWLSKNPNPKIIKFLRENMELVSWDFLAGNKNEEVFKFFSANFLTHKIMYENKDTIFWNNLSENPAPWAIQILRTNPHMINLNFFAVNTSPEVPKIIMENCFAIQWSFLSRNPAPWAIKMLQDNPSMIEYEYLAGNPSIFSENISDKLILSILQS